MGNGIKICICAAAIAYASPAQAQINKAPETLEIETGNAPAEIRGTVQARPIALFFAGLDTDRNKSVSRAELASGISADWRGLGPSVTGKVGAFKIEDWALETLGSRDAYPTRLSFDSNLDNQVSRDEFEDRLTRSFIAMDENDDGALSRAELIFMAAPQIVRKEARRETRRTDDRRN